MPRVINIKKSGVRKLLTTISSRTKHECFLYQCKHNGICIVYKQKNFLVMATITEDEENQFDDLFN